jgi:adenylate cyclase
MSKSAFTRFYRELKQRKVIRVAVAYVIVAWVIVEIASVLFPNLLLPDWAVRLVVGLAIVGFPVALVLAWAVDLSSQAAQPDGRGVAKAEEAPAGPAPPPSLAKDGFDSIAVLPFLNLSNDPDNEYFSDGMSEELLNLLCKLPQLTVASRTSSFSFKGKDADMATVARQLGVDIILEGSVRRSGDRVRITAQLIDAHKDRHLWSETYDRELKDVFSVQDEIARNIVSALQLSLSPAQQKSLQTRGATQDMDAYDFYLRGRYYAERGEFRHGLSMFEKAIELDPDYALAWAGAADCHSWATHWIEDTPEIRKGADDCSLKALSLAPELAEAHASRCLALQVIGHYAEAEREAAAATELDPQLFEAHYYLGRACFTQGKFDEAIESFKRARLIRPDDVAAATLLTTSYKSAGREAEADAAARASIKVVERYLSLNPDDALALSRAANDQIYLGEMEKGVAWAERAYAINPSVCAYNVACTFSMAGQHERALEVLEEHVRTGAVQLDWLVQDSDMDPLREYPRFQAIVATLKRRDL